MADIHKKVQEIRETLNLVDQEEFSTDIRAIAMVASETVARTLGPYAHTTIIDDGTSSYPTKDGWTVLSRLKFPDPLYQSIYRMLLQISYGIVDKVGDGTTTAMVTAQNFIESMTKAQQDNEMAEQSRQADTIKTLKKVASLIQEEISKMAIPVVNAKDLGSDGDPYRAIYNVAYVSSNGNEAIAKAIYEIYNQTGNPNILCDMAGPENVDVSYDIQRGYRLDCKPLMFPRYINTSDKTYSDNELDHIMVIFDHNVAYSKHHKFIDALLQNVQRIHDMNTGRASMLVLMAPYFDDVMSSTIAHVVDEMMRNKPNTIPNLMLIQIPELSRHQVQCYLKDFASIANAPVTTGTKVEIFNEMIHNAEHPEDEQINDPRMRTPEFEGFKSAQAILDSSFSIVRDITIGRNYVALNQINFESVRYKECLQEAKTELEKAKDEAANATTTLMKSLLEATDRLNRLSGSIGVIHAGGASELERRCNMDSIDDTFRACRAAYKNGVVPGLNLAPLVAIKRVEAGLPKWTHSDAERSLLIDYLDIFDEAYRKTTLRLLENKKPSGGPNKCEWSAYITGNETFGIMNAEEIIEWAIKSVDAGHMTSYDIRKEEGTRSEIPEVCNPADTDIEILNGIVGILSMVLTSNQYLSVSRFYDKAATEKRQQQMMVEDTRLKAQVFLNTLSEYHTSFAESPQNDSMVAALRPGVPKQFFYGKSSEEDA